MSRPARVGGAVMPTLEAIHFRADSTDRESPTAEHGTAGPHRWNRPSADGAGSAAVLKLWVVRHRCAATRKTAQRLARPTASIYLSLVLMIVAFFLVLIAISRPDQSRSDMALQSLVATFAVPSPVAREEKIAVVKSGDVLDGASPLKPLAEALADRLSLIAVEHRRTGSELSWTVPESLLFVDHSPQLQPQSRDIIARIATALSAAEGEPSMAVAVLLPAVGHHEGVRSITHQRAGRLAEALEAAGIAETQLSAGMTASDPGLVRFRFLAEGAIGPSSRGAGRR